MSKRRVRPPEESPPAAITPASVRLWPALLVLAAIVVYANSLTGVFTFDDTAALVRNESIRRLWPPTVPLSPPSRDEPVAGRPVVNLSFALNYAIDGLEPRGYHVVNIALHVLTGLLIFGVARRTLAHLRSWEHPDTVAFSGVLLWLVHPLTTETVDYISQRTELLMSLFLMLTLYCSLRAATESSRKWPLAAVGACALGMACKETMATAPLLVVLYDRVFLYTSFADAVRQRGGLYAGLAATWVLLGALIWSGPRSETAGFSVGLSPWTYLLNEAPMLVEYMKRIVWPTSLVLDYGEPRVLTLFEVLPQASLVVVLLILTGVALARWPASGFAAAACFLILAPTSSFIPIATEVGAERRMYLPLAAAVFLVVVAVAALWRHAGRLARTGVVATAFLLAVPLGILTIERNTEYADELGLWRSSLDRWPQPRAHRNYATLLKREGFRDEVIEHLRLSLDDARHPEARYALGYELYEQGRTTEAVAELQQFVRRAPGHSAVPVARGIVGDTLLAMGRFQEAGVEYEAIVKIQPTFAKAWSNLGVSLVQSGNGARGIEAMKRAVALDARDGVAQRNLAGALIGMGLIAEALPHAQAAVQLDPGSAPARLFLGAALAASGGREEALTHLRRALELDPSMAEARAMLSDLTQVRRSAPSTAP